MSTNLIVSIGPMQAATPRLKKPRKLYAGVLRTMIRKTRARLLAIQSKDARAINRAAVTGIPNLSVMGGVNSVNGRAFKRVIERLQECLDAHEGDE